ncbi:hypothetical protein [Paenibacillus sabinae]|uniref:Lipoprotein n=1 Tax=Paenibacillus sabinae T27 TaxID=1268072 RepID=X5A648_9BACL|nr:hypothetical protein [Paenibacillus sabinae]AHV99259.1 hypothetical protein PSAB_21850 [Paenibacillus sabinae T27]
MKTRQKFLTAAAVCLTLLLSACGKDGEETSASSFSSVQNTSVSDEEQNSSQVNEDRKAAGDSAAALHSASPEASPGASPFPGSATAAVSSAEPSPGSATAASSSAAPSPASTASASSDAKQTPLPKTEASNSAPATNSAKGTPSADGAKAGAGKPAAVPANSAAAKTSGASRQASAAAASPTREPASPSVNSGNGGKTEAASSAAPAKSPNAASPSGTVTIGWSDFFDGGDQTRPSERFWDLSESKSTVTIKGFMGEVLSFEKHWFLLIPQPGAECPFDNGDETYWNKIMIVFVPDDVKLRHKSGPLQVTGRLEVGIKIDESGYKTMFRLYDASFEEIKE